MPSFVLSLEEGHSVRACGPRADIAIEIEIECCVELETTVATASLMWGRASALQIGAHKQA
jgi:hypothetical protein